MATVHTPVQAGKGNDTPSVTQKDDGAYPLLNVFMDEENHNQNSRLYPGGNPLFQPLDLNDTLLDNQVFSVKVHLPAFTKKNIDLWFTFVENEFIASRVRSDFTKFNAVTQALDADTLNQVSDVVRNPPAQDKYITLKTAILKRISDPREKQLHKLLKEMALADKKPSQLLREMRNLAASDINDDIPHQLWLEQIPMHIKPHLITFDQMDLDTLAELADKIMDWTSSPYVMATSASHRQNSAFHTRDRENNDMHQTLLACVRDIKELKIQQQTQYQLQLQQQLQQVPPQSPHPRHRARSRSQTPNHGEIL